MAESLADLFVRLSADTSDFKPQLEDAGKQIDDLGGKATGLKSSLDDTQSSFAKFGESVGGFIQHPLQSAGEGVTNFLTVLGPMGTVALAAGAGLAELGHKITELVLEEGAAAEATQNFADRLNLSFEETKKYGEMAEIAGISISVLERASVRLALAFEDSGGAGKKTAEALDAMGINADGTGQTLVKFLEHLATIPDYSDRVAAATEVLGKRSALSLEPMIKNFASLQEAVESLGGSLSSDMVNALLKADDAADKLGIAWSHLKENIAATFAPAVTAGLDLLVKLLSGAPTLTLDQQLMKVNEQLIQLNTNTNSKSFRLLYGLYTEGVAPTPDQRDTSAEQTELERQKYELKGRIAGEARSKEYNDELNASNRANQIWVNGAKERAKEWAKAQDDLFAEENQRFKEDAESINAQQAAWEQLTKDLKAFHLELSDPVVDEKREALVRLEDAATRGWIHWTYYKQAVAEFNKTVRYDFPTAADAALLVVDQMDQKFQHFNESVTHVRDVLRSFESSAFKPSALLAELNASVPFDATMEARKKGTPLGDLLLRAGINRDTDELRKITDLQLGMDAPESTARDAQILFGNAASGMRRLAESAEGLKRVNDLYRQYIAIQEQDGMSLGRISQLRQQQLQLNIQEKALRGESATEEIVHFKQLQLQQELMIGRSQFLGKMYVGLMDDFSKAFGMVGSAITDQIIQIDKEDSAWTKLVKNIEKMFLETLIQGVFKQLGMELINLTGLAGGLGKIFGVSPVVIGGAAGTPPFLPTTGLLGGIGKLFGGKTGSGEAGRETGGIFHGTTEGGYEGSGEGGGGGAGLPGVPGVGSVASSGLMKGLGIASLGVDVASGIATGIQLAHIESDVAKIEISTRQTKEQLTGGIQFALNTWLPKLDNITSGWAVMQKMLDVLQYGLINVNIASATGGMDIAAAVGQQRIENGQRNMETGGQTGYQGQVVDPEVSQFVANTARLGRGLADLNTSVEAIAKTAGGYQLKAGESFGSGNSPFLASGPQTLQDIYATFSRELGMSVEQVNANIRETIDEGIKRGWIATNTTVEQYLLGAGMKTSATQINASGYMISGGAIALDENSPWTQYREGKIDFADFNKRVDAATKAYQDAMLPAAQAAEAQRRASDPMVQAFAASTRAHFDLFTSTQALQKQVDAAQQSFYLANSGTALYDLARQYGPDAALQQAAFNSAALSLKTNTLGPGVALQGGLGPGGALPAFSDAQIQTSLGQFQQQLQGMSTLAAQQTAAAAASSREMASKVFSETYSAWIDGFDIVMQAKGGGPAALGAANTGGMYLDSQGNIYGVRKDDPSHSATFQRLGNYLKLYSEYENTSMRSYASAPLDYSAMFRNYASNLNTQWQTPGSSWNGAPLVGANSVRQPVAQVTVNALNQSGRAAADSLILGLQWAGINVR